ncbi:MAG: type II toxin-antitoxin system VapC family toxin [Verrucomicrobiota bacterium]
MDLLLDSHALLWALIAPEKLSKMSAAEIRNPARAVFYSPASVWELEIKIARGKLSLPDNWTDALARAGFLELAISTAHAVTAARLPWHHQDPFDRMLIAQAQTQGLRLVSRDRFAETYGVPLLEA